MRLECICGATIALVLTLGACSNGRGSLDDPASAPVETPPDSPPSPSPPTPSPPPPPPQAASIGYWIGELKPERGRNLGARAFVTSAGDIHLIVSERRPASSPPEFVVYGNVCCGTAVDAELQSIRYLSSTVDAARFRATVSNDVMSGEVGIRDADYEFTLSRSARPPNPLAPAELAGTYTITRLVIIGVGTTYAITIDPSGELNGSQTNGCIYNGTAQIAEAAYHLVRLDVQVSNCPRVIGSGVANGNYSGLGVLENDGRTFLHSLVGPTWLGQQPVVR